MTEKPQNKRFTFFWYTSWRMLWRDWRAGELSILAVGLVIAVTSITAVGFFTERIERGLKQQSAELIGADLVITSGRSDVSDYIEGNDGADLIYGGDGLFKLLYLVSLNLSEKWTMPIHNWSLIFQQLSVHFEERLEKCQ